MIIVDLAIDADLVDLINDVLIVQAFSSVWIAFYDSGNEFCSHSGECRSIF